MQRIRSNKQKVRQGELADTSDDLDTCRAFHNAVVQKRWSFSRKKWAFTPNNPKSLIDAVVQVIWAGPPNIRLAEVGEAVSDYQALIWGVPERGVCEDKMGSGAGGLAHACCGYDRAGTGQVIKRA